MRTARMAAVIAAVLATVVVSAGWGDHPPRTKPGRATHSEGTHRAASSTQALFDVKLTPPGTVHTVGDYSVLDEVGRVQPGTQDTQSFILPKLAGMSVVLLGRGLTWSFRAPSGEIFVPGKTTNRAGYDYVADPKGMAVFNVKDPETGVWAVTTNATETDTTVQYAIFIQAVGPAEETPHLETMLRDSDPRITFLARPGDPVYVRAFVAKNGRPIPGVAWEVHAFTPRDSFIAIPVFDDGRHADGKPDDGVFVGAVVTEGPDGLYRLRAKGRTLSGVEYIVVGAIDVQAKNDLLIADSIAVSPRNPKAGEPVTLTVTAMNDGSAEFKNAKLELYVDRQKVSGQKLDLEPGESRRVATTWVPSQPQDYVVQLTLRSSDEPYASDFTNNTRRTTVKVR